MFVMFTYDVPAERTVYYRKLLRRYLGHEQFSVFFGDLPESKLEKLRSELRKLVKQGDQLCEFTAPNRHNLDIRVWSKTGSDAGVPAVVYDTRHHSDSVVL